MAVTGSDSTPAPRWASARTMSRSLAIPSTAVPSCETTTAQILCSARTASRRRTVVSGVTVTTWVPLPRSTSLIRIGPPDAPTPLMVCRTGTPAPDPSIHDATRRTSGRVRGQDGDMEVQGIADGRFGPVRECFGEILAAQPGTGVRGHAGPAGAYRGLLRLGPACRP